LIRYPYTGEGANGFAARGSRYDAAFLRRLFYEMLRIRIIEEEIERRYHLDQMKTPIHLVLGQEATSVGCCAALTHDDLLYSTHRTHGNYLAKGGDLKAMLSEMHCRANGCAGSRGGSMHLIDKGVGMAGTSAIVGASMPLATGAALAAKMCKAQRAVVAFFGDAATEEGAASESLNFATLKGLPVVFFCENNFYSVQSPLHHRQPARSLCTWAASYGMPAARVDGTNVLTVYEAAREASARARRGDGPSFIEAPVYRFRAHGGSGDDSQSGYRSVQEREAWESVCPVETYYAYLRSAGILDDERRREMRSAIECETNEAFDFAIRSPEPVEADLYRHVYAPERPA
jgi:acetoin:2,6-dichlorophenolindophenol oxidoreductase subunit alpha